MSKNKPSRRQFLKAAATGVAAAAATNPSQAFFFPPPTYPAKRIKAVVIGSGFGGAVTGYRLAQAGIPTLMLERGQWWTGTSTNKWAPNIFSANLPADHRGYWFKTLSSAPPIKVDLPILPYAGLVDYTDFNGIRTYQGSCVGGGSLSYAGVTFRTPSNVLKLIFGDSFDVNEFETKYYPRAEAIIAPEVMPDSIFNTKYYRYAQVFKQHAEKAGYSVKKTPVAFDFNIVQQEINGTIKLSALIGETLYGNNNGCKKSLDKSYIKLAMNAGMTVSALTEVDSIAPRREGGYSIFTKKINEWGTVQYYQEIQCDYLFMAAGTVGTNTLLLRAKAEGYLANLNQHAGTRVGSNSDVTFSRTVIEPLGNLESAPLSLTLEDYNNPYGPIILECAYFPTGLDTHSLVHFGVHFDKDKIGPGKFTYSTTLKKLQMDWPNDADTKAILAHKHIVDRLNQVNGGIAGIPILMPTPSTRRVVHPLGGMPLGLATDMYGRVHNYKNLYVMDGTLIPGNCQVNPSLTIAALAERNIEKLLAEDIRA